MSIDLRFLIDCIEKFSPPKLALPGDFVGVQLGPHDPIAQKRFKFKKCVVSLQATPQVIAKAASSGANVLIVYHGLMSNPVKALTDTLLDKIRLLVEKRIVLYVVHTSWLSAECGVNDTFAEILDTNISEVFNIELEGKNVPLGRICNLGRKHEETSDGSEEVVRLSDFVKKISERLGGIDVLYAGSLQAPVKRVLLLAGEYGREDWLQIAKDRHVDTYLTSSISRGVAMLSSELELNYVCVDHYIVESLGMRRLMQLLNINLPEVDFSFVESESPWKKYSSRTY